MLSIVRLAPPMNYRFTSMQSGLPLPRAVRVGARRIAAIAALRPGCGLSDG